MRREIDKIIIVVLTGWICFHLFAQIQIPIYMTQKLTSIANNKNDEQQHKGPLRDLVRSYLYLMHLYHHFGFFSAIMSKNIRLTIESAQISERPPPGFFLNSARPRDFNYFQSRFMVPLLIPSGQRLIQFAGKTACKKLNLTDDITVNYYQTSFNLNKYSEEVKVTKLSTIVSCEGLIK